MKHSKTTTDLVVQAQLGNQKALVKLVEIWHVQFCKFSYWYTKDAHLSKDIAQESWIVIFKKIGTLKHPKKFKSWALSIVHRKSIDWLRRAQREDNKLQTYYKALPKQQQNDTADTASQQKTKKHLLNAIHHLPIAQREVIHLFYLEGHSINQIASLLKISIGTIKTRLFRAREKLKSNLKPRYYEN